MSAVRNMHAPAHRNAMAAIFAVVVLGLAAMILAPAGVSAQEAGTVPGNALGNSSDTNFWRAVREGTQGTVAGANDQAGVMIQSDGSVWRAFRNGPLSTYGIWAMAGIFALLAVFFILRGRVRIEAGKSGQTVTRFNGFERFSHWLLAVSFIILALSGLNILYGRYFLLNTIGPEAFGTLTYWGKWMHNYVAFAFMLGVVLIFVQWVVHNLPSRHDIGWIIRAGGLLSKHSHPPAKKFNAGQKLIFWVVVLGGVSISLSGISLLFPFQFPMFAKTFVVLNMFGAQLPTELSAMQEMQLAQVWHTAVAIFMIVVIVAHIYIGSIGMEGAFDAMGSGEVDKNWAREHHSIWMEKIDGPPPSPPSTDNAKADAQVQPAE